MGCSLSRYSTVQISPDTTIHPTKHYVLPVKDGVIPVMPTLKDSVPIPHSIS